MREEEGNMSDEYGEEAERRARELALPDDVFDEYDYIGDAERRAREPHDRTAGRQWAALLGVGGVFALAVTWSLRDPSAACWVISGLLTLGSVLALIMPAYFAMILSGGHFRGLPLPKWLEQLRVKRRRFPRPRFMQGRDESDDE